MSNQPTLIFSDLHSFSNFLKQIYNFRGNNRCLMPFDAHFMHFSACRTCIRIFDQKIAYTVIYSLFLRHTYIKNHFNNLLSAPWQGTPYPLPAIRLSQSNMLECPTTRAKRAQRIHAALFSHFTPVLFARFWRLIFCKNCSNFYFVDNQLFKIFVMILNVKFSVNIN